MYEIVTLGRGWLHYIASAHIMVNVVEEIYQCWNKNWIVFYVKFVLSTKNYDDDDDASTRDSSTEIFHDYTWVDCPYKLLDQSVATLATETTVAIVSSSKATVNRVVCTFATEVYKKWQCSIVNFWCTVDYERI